MHKTQNCNKLNLNYREKYTLLLHKFTSELVIKIMCCKHVHKGTNFCPFAISLFYGAYQIPKLFQTYSHSICRAELSDADIWRV